MFKCAKKLAARCSHAAWRMRSIEERMEEASSFEEWQVLASDLDAIREELKRGHAQTESLYDEKLLSAKVQELTQLRNKGRIEWVMFSLRADLFRNFGNITNRCVVRYLSMFSGQYKGAGIVLLMW
jgi:hypothetical protein